MIITPGGGNVQISTTDRWYAELRSGRAFGAGFLTAAGVGSFSKNQLKNPAGSGKQVIVYNITNSTPVAGRLWFVAYDVDLTNDFGAGFNRLLGGAAGVAHGRFLSDGTLPGTVMEEVGIGANIPYTTAVPFMFELSPGKGLYCVVDTLNQALTTNFQWIEL